MISMHDELRIVYFTSFFELNRFCLGQIWIKEDILSFYTSLCHKKNSIMMRIETLSIDPNRQLRPTAMVLNSSIEIQ